MAAPVRLWLLLAPLLLAGCTQPGASPPPTPGPLPPSLLVDRALQGTLQLYVHAKQGNVRYDFINLSVENATLLIRASAYAVDHTLPEAAAHVEVEAVDAGVVYHWAARVALNETARPTSLIVETWDGEEGYSFPREFALPYEKLLPRESDH